MRTLFDYRDVYDEIPDRMTPQEIPGIDFRRAHVIAQQLAAAQSKRLGFAIKEEKWLIYIPEKASYLYGLKSTRDVSDEGGGTAIFFDANTGLLQETSLPTGQHSGATVSTWLYALHMARVWGTPFRIFVCLMGGGSGHAVGHRRCHLVAKTPGAPFFTIPPTASVAKFAIVAAAKDPPSPQFSDNRCRWDEDDHRCHRPARGARGVADRASPHPNLRCHRSCGFRGSND